MEKIVFIDVTEINKITFTLQKNAIVKKVIKKGQHLNLLFLLDSFLKSQKLSLGQITTFVLLEGSGSFSSVRQAAAILNVVHLVSGAKVIGLDKKKYKTWQDILNIVKKSLNSGYDGFIKPIYANEPNITKPKQK